MNPVTQATDSPDGPRHSADSPVNSSLSNDLNSDLLSAIAGREANRERTVAHRTRRVVMSSAGVLKEQSAEKRRARALALAFAVVLLLLIAPLLWAITEHLAAGEHFGDTGSQLALWACILCPTLLGVALMAGWLRNRS